MFYEFTCEDCGTFEVNQSMLSDHKSNCPQCGKEAQRIYAVLEVVWAGEAYRPDGSRREHDDYTSVMKG